jgi:hypothetical protein
MAAAADAAGAARRTVDPDQRCRMPDPLVMFFKLKEFPRHSSAVVKGMAGCMGMRLVKDEPGRSA